MRPPFTACPDDILHFPQRTNPAVEGTTATYSGQAEARGACWKPAVALAQKALLCLSALQQGPELTCCNDARQWEQKEVLHGYGSSIGKAASQKKRKC